MLPVPLLMASATVAVRLPNEVLEELQKKAAAQNKKVSDYVRELIVSDLQRVRTFFWGKSPLSYLTSLKWGILSL